jgi:three-Cys-motif partner protein
MIQIPEHYKGREQAYFKHKLLEAYLERLFMIVGQHHKTICYIDCFAGPWQEKGDNLEDTSIAISLNIIRKCRDGLKKLGKQVHFKALFIEQDQKAYEKLENFLQSKKDFGVETESFQGEFFALRPDILNWCAKDSFAFFFIDPTGWKYVVELSTLEPLLRRRNSEFMINFMYDFLLRTHTQMAFENDMREIFGKVPVTAGLSPEQRESHLMKLYCDNLKKVSFPGSGKPRTAFVKIRYPLRDRTLYHLVYLTRHPLGIVKFMEASQELDLVQWKVREQAKQETRIKKSGQEELFGAHEQIDGEEGHVDLSTVKEYWLKHLASQPIKFGVEALADMLEETGWFISDFQTAFKELEKDHKVKNLDTKRTRPVNAVNFEKGERLVRK